jgi:uncharacterized radical SAM superfamily Fe-S cluster-containing enzyme
MTIKQYNGTDATFYIQCKGSHSGRPLRTPIPNCFAVFTDIHNAFEIAYAAYVSKHYHRHLKGSVIPYLRIADVEEVLGMFIDKIDEQNTQRLEQIERIDNAIEAAKKQLTLLEQAKILIARRLI